MYRRAPPWVARHGTTLKWSFAVSYGALDDETKVGDGDPGVDSSRQYWHECKKAHARWRGTAMVPQARPRGLASVSILGRLGPRCRWSSSLLLVAVILDLRGSAASWMRVLNVTNVGASLTRSARLVVL